MEFKKHIFAQKAELELSTQEAIAGQEAIANNLSRSSRKRFNNTVDELNPYKETRVKTKVPISVLGAVCHDLMASTYRDMQAIHSLDSLVGNELNPDEIFDKESAYGRICIRHEMIGVIDANMSWARTPVE